MANEHSICTKYNIKNEFVKSEQVILIIERVILPLYSNV